MCFSAAESNNLVRGKWEKIFVFRLVNFNIVFLIYLWGERAGFEHKYSMIGDVVGDFCRLQTMSALSATILVMSILLRCQ